MHTDSERQSRAINVGSDSKSTNSTTVTVTAVAAFFHTQTHTHISDHLLDTFFFRYIYLMYWSFI